MVNEPNSPRDEEEKRLLVVLEQVGRRMRKELSLLGDRREDVVGIRQEFWDDVRMNFSDSTEVGETWSSIVQQAELLAERERSHRVASEAVERLTKQFDSPYFARIDFAEKDSGTEVIYIGRASLVGEDGETFFVYDWRAPVSSLFYDHEPGPATYRVPDGRMEGELKLKRQFVIRGGQMKHMFDTSETVGDEILQAVLSEGSDTSMKSIVATIQKEQNWIIRNEKHKLLVVQGAAGSGKTSAALQRIAYLLYRFRETLGPDQIILFSPNPVFKGYISRVLPDLGEANMKQMTFRELIEARLGRRFEVEDLFSQTEALVAAEGTAEGEARERSVRYKGSEHFFITVENYLKRLEQEGVRFRPLRFRSMTLVSAEEMSQQFYGIRAADGFGTRAAGVRRWLLERIKLWVDSQMDEQWLEEAAELVDGEEIQRAYVDVRRRGGFHDEAFDDEDQMSARLRRRVAEQAVAPLVKAVRSFRFLDAVSTYRELFESRSLFSSCSPDGVQPVGWEWMLQRAELTMGRKVIDHEDATPLMYVLEALEGFRRVEGDIQHVFVDEAQDYSPFQAAYLRRRYPRARLTVLGDFNQAIYIQSQESGGFGGWTRLMAPEATSVLRLTTSYRSTEPIVRYTKLILPAADAADITPFQRDGEAPRLFPCKDGGQLGERIAEDIIGLLGRGYGTIGVITKTAYETGNASALLKEQLPDDVPVTLVTGGSAELPKGVSVLPAYLAKGIEFDAVLVWDASLAKYGKEKDRKLLYTVCTRALHVLHIYHTGEASPWLPSEK
ncbi:RNA polymerase recycling motor HelD [Cohnella lupini]|uniref:DNA helicase-2/ATP-dependent DNA helicase PcrA n=1 Tax=Cohnella lupini TaxID=1294267 RepID=A0A3D9IS46_9BACL|nr:RNA polymerase recycling motor HelD [Cohnella lupini]RED63936.1 DNA helicase-2/ATP-dependent DNA helicase PcrA [Cohnella lupini]